MKKAIRVLLILALVLMMVNILTNCRYMYGESHTRNSLTYTEHDLLPVCFVSHYSWNPNTTRAVVDLAEECEGKTVTSLGGYEQCPFLVNLPHSRYGCGEDLLPENAVIEQYHMTINLGKNIRKVEWIGMDEYHCVRTNRFVQILVTIHCPEENRWFYSENGKLYHKDGTLVTGFFYASDYEP